MKVYLAAIAFTAGIVLLILSAFMFVYSIDGVQYPLAFGTAFIFGWSWIVSEHVFHEHTTTNGVNST